MPHVAITMIPGRVLAVGCGARSDIERSQFPQEAYQLGLSLK